MVCALGHLATEATDADRCCPRSEILESQEGVAGQPTYHSTKGLPIEGKEASRFPERWALEPDLGLSGKCWSRALPPNLCPGFIQEILKGIAEIVRAPWNDLGRAPLGCRGLRQAVRPLIPRNAGVAFDPSKSDGGKSANLVQSFNTCEDNSRLNPAAR